jgi:cellulose synthase/poly-beta-1,6-N-acetylglucosamine synthase-like glycosyltransferase
MMEWNESMAKHELSISVIVPVHRDGESFQHCLSSLAKSVPAPEEIILVSDGAGDPIRRLARKFGFRCCETSVAKGPAYARHLGASQAQGSILFFIDSDVTLPPGTMTQVRQLFSHDPGLAAVIGSYDNAPAALNFLSQYKNLFHHYTHQNSSEEASTFWGACGAIRRDIFLELGGFDEHYLRPCIEDIELGSRIKKAGHRIRLSKTLLCKHWKQWGVFSLLKSDFFDRALPWTELILRDRSLTNDLNLRFASRFSVVFLFAFIGTFLAGFWKLVFAGVSLVFLAMVLAMNFPVYRFFYRNRGLWFMIRVIPWHCIYYLCGGTAFALGVARALTRKTMAFLGISVHNKNRVV